MRNTRKRQEQLANIWNTLYPVGQLVSLKLPDGGFVWSKTVGLADVNPEGIAVIALQRGIWNLTSVTAIANAPEKSGS